MKKLITILALCFLPSAVLAQSQQAAKSVRMPSQSSTPSNLQGTNAGLFNLNNAPSWRLNTGGIFGFGLLGVFNTWTKAQNVAASALVDSGTIATDASLSNVFTVTIAGSRTLANPTNLVSGGTYIFIVTQGAGGSHTLAYGNLFKWPGGTAPTLSTAAAAVDMISCVYNGTILACVGQLNFS